MHPHEHYIRRCIDLALKGAGQVSPNPMVGAVLVHHDRIIGEGWHRQYGQAHAEVNCIASVAVSDRHLIPESTMYVSLEPCAHHGRTPPCADLIVQQHIPRVVIGCIDTFSQVSGKGIEKLLQAGIEVITGVLEKECRYLNRRFFSRQEQKRPYVILKWAQSADGFLAPEQGRRVMLSNDIAQRWVHLMRAEEDAILVGYQTALLDDPQLSNRSGAGKQPLRIVIDPELQLPAQLHVFNRQQPTLVFNYHKEEEEAALRFIRMDETQPVAAAIAYGITGINSLIIEGGGRTLQQFIDAGLWDEAFVIHTPPMLEKGIKAPVLQKAVLLEHFPLLDNTINHYQHEHTRRLYPHQ